MRHHHDVFRLQVQVGNASSVVKLAQCLHGMDKRCLGVTACADDLLGKQPNKAHTSIKGAAVATIRASVCGTCPSSALLTR